MSKEAMKLALDALKRMKRYGNTFGYRSHEQNPYEQVCEAITALEALAEQPAQQEPVAVHQFRKRGCSDWYDGHPDHTDGGGPYEARTLYTSPPAQRKPLTDEELDAMFSKTLKGKKLVNWVARAIEAAHNIKEKP